VTDAVGLVWPGERAVDFVIGEDLACGLGPDESNSELWPRASLSPSWGTQCSGPARLLIQLLFHFFKYFPIDFTLEITKSNFPNVQK
jgi:hypothetical protein